MKTKFYTYVIFTKDDASVPTYVGKGTGLRLKAHIHNDSYFGNHLRKQVQAGVFPVYIKKFQATEKAAFAEEMRLIKLYGRKKIGTGSLYNLTEGGEGTSGHFHTEESKATMSERIKSLWQKEGHKEKVSSTMTKLKQKPCTIDGKTIFKSVGELVSTLGFAARQDQNFRFIQKGI